jgi:sugar lactone lactonase YvrE
MPTPMQRRQPLIAFVIAVLASACSGGRGGYGAPEAAVDTSTGDTLPFDASEVDAGAADVLAVDGLAGEAGALDGTVPAVSPDATPVDASGAGRASDGRVADQTLPADSGRVDSLECPPEQIACSGVCTDLSTDPANCGSCGNACFTGEACAGGACVAVAVPTLSLLSGSLMGPGTTDGVGDAAHFEDPIWIAPDGAGDLYVSDVSADTIRKIVLATGMVTTLAGAPNQAGSTDGPVGAARFQSPAGLAFDPTIGAAGGLYVADSGNDTIRVIDLGAGTVSTLVGVAGTAGNADGAGTAAELNAPNGLWLDGAGNLYVADGYNWVIRKIVTATATVTTVTARLPGGLPFGLVGDGQGHLYVSCNYNVLAIDLSSGAASLLVGLTTFLRFPQQCLLPTCHPQGLALDGQGHMYVADWKVSRVLEYDLTTQSWAGSIGSDTYGFVDGIGAAAEFGGAQGLALDASGALFVADTGNSAIRQVDLTTDAVTTVAGGTSRGNVDGPGQAARFDHPQALAVDPISGLAYVADWYNFAVRLVDLSTGQTSTLPDPGGTTYGPLGVALDGEGQLYLSASSYNVGGDGLAPGGLLDVDLASDAATDVGGLAKGMGRLVFDAHADLLYYTGWNAILTYNPATGANTTLAGTWGTYSTPGSTDGSLADALFAGPSGLALDGTDLYVADTGNDTLRKVDLEAGLVTTLAGAASSAGAADGVGPAARFNQPADVAFEGGALYVADTGNGTIREVNPQTGSVSTRVGVAGTHGITLGALPARLDQPIAVAADPRGGLLIIDDNCVLTAR